MRVIIRLFILLLSGCTSANRSNGVIKSLPKNPALSVVDLNKQAEQKRKQKAYRESEHNDSLHLQLMLKDLLLFARHHKSENYFKKKLRIWHFESESSSTLTFGHLFEKNQKHLIVIRSLGDWNTWIDVFKLEKSKFVPVLSANFDSFTYLNEINKDVNGDQYKDVLIHWYPSSGCCRRNTYDVYLYQPKCGGFTEKYNFINPTFYPSEKIIRGIGYGQPGEVDLYKYRWNGLKIDSLEFIMPDSTNSRFHVVTHWGDLENNNKGTFVSYVPKEYHSIESYDWFKGIY